MLMPFLHRGSNAGGDEERRSASNPPRATEGEEKWEKRESSENSILRV